MLAELGEQQAAQPDAAEGGGLPAAAAAAASLEPPFPPPRDNAYAIDELRGHREHPSGEYCY